MHMRTITCNGPMAKKDKRQDWSGNSSTSYYIVRTLPEVLTAARPLYRLATTTKIKNKMYAYTYL